MTHRIQPDDTCNLWYHSHSLGRIPNTSNLRAARDQGSGALRSVLVLPSASVSMPGDLIFTKPSIQPVHWTAPALPDLVPRNGLWDRVRRGAINSLPPSRKDESTMGRQELSVRRPSHVELPYFRNEKTITNRVVTGWKEIYEMTKKDVATTRPFSANDIPGDTVLGVLKVVRVASLPLNAAGIVVRESARKICQQPVMGNVCTTLEKAREDMHNSQVAQDYSEWKGAMISASAAYLNIPRELFDRAITDIERHTVFAGIPALLFRAIKEGNRVTRGHTMTRSSKIEPTKTDLLEQSIEADQLKRGIVSYFLKKSKQVRDLSPTVSLPTQCSSKISRTPKTEGPNSLEAGLYPLTLQAQANRPWVNSVTQSVRQEIETALNKLPPRHKEILEWRYGLGDGIFRPRSEIAEKFGVTPARIAQIEKGALRNLYSRGETRKILERALEEIKKIDPFR